MLFFDLDLHIGSLDIQNIFESLGHSLDIWSLSNHNHLVNWKRPKVDVINEKTWYNLNPLMCDNFYNRYKDELSEYNGFVTFYPPTFSMIYEKFNKPIIMNVPIRYETPLFYSKELWENFNNYLRDNIDNSLIIPISNNLYDSKYFELFVERECLIISSLCNYTNSQYTGKNNQFLYCSKNDDLINLIRVPNIINKSKIKNHAWQDIADFKAIVYIPYSNTLMSVFEQYNSNIPLLFPSKEFLFHLKEREYKGIMSELSNNKIYSKPFEGFLTNKSIISYSNSNIPDPNDYNSLETFKYWSVLSDFYDEERFPYIQHFDSFMDLEDKLYSLPFEEISDNMRKYNIKRKKRILKQWKEVFKKVS